MIHPPDATINGAGIDADWSAERLLGAYHTQSTAICDRNRRKSFLEQFIENVVGIKARRFKISCSSQSAFQNQSLLRMIVSMICLRRAGVTLPRWCFN